METITREEAFQLLKKYNKDPFHIQHALDGRSRYEMVCQRTWTWS